MKRLYLLLIGFLLLIPCFLKAQKGEVIWERGGQTPAASFSFSPDSTEFIIGDYSSEISIRNTETGLVVRKFSLQSSDNLVTWSPQTNLLAVLTHRYIGNFPETALLLMDASDGRILQEVVPYYGDVAFSPDGKYLYSNKYQGGGITAELQDTIIRIFNFPWERFVILPGDNTAIVWEKDSLHLVSFPEAKPIMKYSALGQVWESDIEVLAIDRINGRAAIVTDGNKFLKVFNFETGEIVQQWTMASRIDQLAFSPDGNTLAVGRFNSVEFLDMVSGNLISTESIQTHYRGFIRFEPEGNRLFIGAYSGYGDCLPANYDRMWEAESNLIIWDRKKQQHEIADGRGHNTKILTMRFSDDFTSITTVDYDSLALTWETETGELLKREKVADFPATDFTSVSPSGKYKLISGSYDFGLWDNISNELLYSLPYQKQMTSVHGRTFTPDEQFVLASLEYYYMGTGSGKFPPQELHIWSTETGQKTDSILIPCFLSHIQVSGDNRYIAGVTFDSRVIVISAEGLLTSVEDPYSQNLLKTSIYPNPVIENSTISYTVVKPEFLKISVHDIFGREVAVLKNEIVEPGSHTIPFKSGELSEGLYFLKTTTGSKSMIKSFGILR